MSANQLLHLFSQSLCSQFTGWQDLFIYLLISPSYIHLSWLATVCQEAFMNGGVGGKEKALYSSHDHKFSVQTWLHQSHCFAGWHFIWKANTTEVKYTGCRSFFPNTFLEEAGTLHNCLSFTSNWEEHTTFLNNPYYPRSLFYSQDIFQKPLHLKFSTSYAKYLSQAMIGNMGIPKRGRQEE